MVMAQEWEGGFSCHASAEVLLGRAAQSGDLEAFNALVLRHQDALFNLARYILRDDSLAADAVQEAFLSAFQKIASFRGGSLRAWLMRILVNKCRDDLRRWRRYAEISLESHPPDQDAGGYDTWLCGGEPSPSEQMESRELQHALEYCFHGLPPAFREVAVLVDVEGFTYGEAAQTLRVPVGTIKSRLARARLALRGRLQEFADLLPLRYRVAFR